MVQLSADDYDLLELRRDRPGLELPAPKMWYISTTKSAYHMRFAAVSALLTCLPIPLAVNCRRAVSGCYLLRILKISIYHFMPPVRRHWQAMLA
jgi:hypothetical protein